MARVVTEISSQTDRYTDAQTYIYTNILITILPHPIPYHTIRYIYVRSEADKMATLI